MSLEKDRYSFKVKLSRARKANQGKAEAAAGISFLRQMDAVSRRAPGSSSARGRVAGRGGFVRSPSAASQRVVVKTRLVRHGLRAKSRALLNAHLKYLSRDGVAEDRAMAPKMYNEEGEVSAERVKLLLNEIAQDRHHFRLIVSPEHARSLDLTSYAKEVVAKMETDLGTPLTFMAVNHFNTDNPHAHIIVRGKDQEDKDLIISRDYIANGIRNRAVEIATRELGHRSELEIRQGLTREVTKLGFTQIDSALLKEEGRSADRTIDVRRFKRHERSYEAFRHAVQVRRLKELQKMELAYEVSPGVWQLHAKTKERLTQLSQRNDIIKTMHKALKNHSSQEQVVFDLNGEDQLNITGVVVDKGLSDELSDHKYLVVSALDSRAYYVPLSKYSEISELSCKPGSIVTVSVKKAEGEGRVSDETILEVARKNQGVYSAQSHVMSVSGKKLPDGVTLQDYVENHLKRLEALESRGVVKRLSEKAWEIPRDLKDRIKACAGEKRGNFAKVKLESALTLQDQVGAMAPTWIDQQILKGKSRESVTLRSSFLQELEEAKSSRIEKLVALQYAKKTIDAIKLRTDFQDRLYDLQMTHEKATLSKRYGTSVELSPGQHFSGEMKEIRQLPSGPHAVVADNGRFIVIAYQNGMDRLNGKKVDVAMGNTPARSISIWALPHQKVNELARS